MTYPGKHNKDIFLLVVFLLGGWYAPLVHKIQHLHKRHDLEGHDHVKAGKHTDFASISDHGQCICDDLHCWLCANITLWFCPEEIEKDPLQVPTFFRIKTCFDAPTFNASIASARSPPSFTWYHGTFANNGHSSDHVFFWAHFRLLYVHALKNRDSVNPPSIIQIHIPHTVLFQYDLRKTIPMTVYD